MKAVVILDLPGGREFHWLAPDSPIARWRIGETVFFRDERWQVTGRDDDSEPLKLTLVPLA